MAKQTGAAGARRAASDRLAREADQRLASHAPRDQWPDFVFEFHDGEEIGPRMLARIGKRTGLQPEDL